MKRRFAFYSDTCELAEVRRVARAFLEECGLADSEILILALDEACTNIIRYAYGHARKPMRLEMERRRDRLRFVLRDYGKPCDLDCIRSRALEDFRPGGLGVHIIKHAFDHVSYEPQIRGTKLVLEKLLPAGTNSSACRA